MSRHSVFAGIVVGYFLTVLRLPTPPLPLPYSAKLPQSARTSIINPQVLCWWQRRVIIQTYSLFHQQKSSLVGKALKATIKQLHKMCILIITFYLLLLGNTRQRAHPGSKPKDYRQQCCSFCTFVHSRTRIVSSSLCWWWSSVYTGLALAISKCWTFTRASMHLTGAHMWPLLLVLYNKFTESSEPDSIILSHFLSASLNTTFRKHAPPVIFFQFCWRSRCHPLVSSWPAGWTRVKGKLKAIWVGQRSKSRGEEY